MKLLANFNIQDVVAEKMKEHLSETNLTYDQLKNLLLKKNPIAAVHIALVKQLGEAKKNDLAHVKKALEQQAYKKQSAEDDKQSKDIQNKRATDEENQKKLTNELNHIPTLLSNYDNEITLIRYKMDRLPAVEVIPQRLQTNKNKPPLRAAKSSSAIEFERLNKSLLEYELKMQTLINRRFTIQNKLREIEDRIEKYQGIKDEIDTRKQARVGYQSTQEEINETLSEANQLLLTRSLQAQNEALETKYDEMISDAQAINYGFFLEQLPAALKDFSLSDSEKTAIQNTLKLMKQHLNHEQQNASAQEMLQKKSSAIQNAQLKVTAMQNKLKNLRNDKPNLTQHNKKLSEENIAQKKLFETNSSLQKNLGTPAWLLLALTLVSTVPLILTIKGIIPFFISPVLLYTLVSAIPALLLMATLAVGISAIVFTYKAHANEAIIAANTQQIAHNDNQMKDNLKTIDTLEKHSIPSLQTQIKKDDATSNQLLSTIKESQLLAQQTLQQAEKIEPLSHAASTVLPAPTGSTSDDEEIEKEDSLSEESELQPQ